jgi:mono/diheme cytochrome c family protein
MAPQYRRISMPFSALRHIGGVLLASASVFLTAACEPAAPPPAAGPDPVAAAQERIRRGEYLVTIGGCIDCHTPGYFMGMPDPNKHLAGSDVGFFIPGMGTFYGPNLTPDPDTGLGNWNEGQIVTALRTGTRPDGRVLAPIMPWMHFASLDIADAGAIAAYLKSLPPVRNDMEVAPVGPAEAPPAPYMAILPPGTPPPAPPGGPAAPQ